MSYLQIETGVVNVQDVAEYPHIQFTPVPGTAILANNTVDTTQAPTIGSTNYLRVIFTSNAVGGEVGSGLGFCVTVSGGMFFKHYLREIPVNPTCFVNIPAWHQQK